MTYHEQRPEPSKAKQDETTRPESSLPAAHLETREALVGESQDEARDKNIPEPTMKGVVGCSGENIEVCWGF